MDKKYIFISSIIACILLYFIEQVIGANYLIKTISKIVLFTMIPYIYIRFIKRVTIKEALNYKNIDKHHLKVGILLGIICFVVVIISYCVLGGAVDFDSIAIELQRKSKISPVNFIFVGLYITFGNSFLEEFFFRGFIFLNLYKLKYKKTAYIFSSLLFALYHITIFKNWFELWITFLAVVALMIVGFIFDWIDTKSNNFVNSWIVHILADSAIIFIGFKMFGIL
ncbi:CPBP family intramembrane glutamic endopeptidase [Haloimpatiens sp. FM7330]|uniref:CPBP family intramembrane glutamic endopeptidase n=1 Tax=Haloimpatiens sp. FM7330 TaxID=3298610 RepID=UPI00363ED8B5